MPRILSVATVFCCLTSSVFAEDAYLESDGTQYIVTGYYPTEKMKLVVDFRITEETKNQSILGNKDAGGSGASFYVWQNEALNLEGCFVSAANTDIWTGRLKTGIGTNRYTVEVDYAEGTFVLLNPDGSYADAWQGVKRPAGERRTGTGNRPLAFFMSAPSFSGTTQPTGSKMKLYSAQVYEAGELIHDYVPCKKGDRVGLYDTKEDRFFGRYAGNPFAFGGDILTVEDDPYVTADGSVSVDTGYMVTPDTCIEADFSFDDNAAQQFLFEAGSANTPFGRVYVNNGQGFSWSWADDPNWTNMGEGSAYIAVHGGVRHTVRLDSYANSGVFTTYGVTNSSFALNTTRTKTPDETIHLFSNSDGAKNFCRGRLYGFRIYERGVLQMDLVPMKSFGVGVLKDTVTGRTFGAFTTNKLGFGGKIKEEPYVDSNGSQQLILDYYPNAKTVIEVDYQVLEKGASKVVFGAYLYHATGFGLQQNGSQNQEFRCHSAWSGGGAGNADLKRHTAVIDNPAHMCYYRTWGVDKTTIDISTKNGYVDPAPTSESELALFGDSNYMNAAGTARQTYSSKVRIFNVRIFEDGVLVHRYEPYADAGCVGFRDLADGNRFFGIDGSDANPLVPGGDIEFGSAADAYIESDGTQAIATDFLPADKTRVEIDFMLRQVPNVSDLFLFGRWADPIWALHINYLHSFTFRTHSAANSYLVTIPGDQARHTAILDRKNGTCSLTDNGEVRSYTASNKSSASSDLPLSIFARTESNGTYYGMTKMRLYSFRVYEDDVLTHECLPYKNGETVGLYDTKSGKVLTNVLADANAFKVGGTAVGGENLGLVVSPTNSFVGVEDTVTLKAYAPGDVTYRWTKDGEVIEGETGPELSVAWQKTRSRESVYTVTPLYHVYSTVVEGEPASATVTYGPMGMVLIYR